MSNSFDPNAAAEADAGLFGLPCTPDESRVVVLPVPWAATTSYGGGAELGPETILAASRQVDLFDLETGRPYEGGIAMLPIPTDIVALHDAARVDALRVIEAGGQVGGDRELAEALLRVNAASARVNAWVYEQASRWLRAGKRIAVVGGDHSTPFGAIRAVAETVPTMGILHIDAHADLRYAYEGFEHSHASIMRNVYDRIPSIARIVQVGIRDFCEDEFEFIRASHRRVVTYFDNDLAREQADGVAWTTIVDRIVGELPMDVYVSFDVDGLDPSLCPHTGTPVPGGLTYRDACQLLRGVVRSGRRIVAVDVNEVAPGPEGDEWDGNVGARLLYKMIGWMVAKS